MATNPFFLSKVQLGAFISVVPTGTVTGEVVVIPTTPCDCQYTILALTESVLKSASIIKGPPL